MRTINLTVVTLGIGLSIANAQTPGNIFSDSLGSINQCYHGMSQSNPCTTNSYSIQYLGHLQRTETGLRSMKTASTGDLGANLRQ
jgi:hypothetical protein